MNRLIIIGAGGHGRVIADIAIKNGNKNICFVDDYEIGDCMGFPIVGTCSEVMRLNDGKTDFVIGIGNNAIRRDLAEKYSVNWITLVHPSAQIAMNVSIGKGTVIMAGAIINVGATVGEHCIINTSCIVEHDNVIENYVHISPGAKLGGTVHVGKQTHIGIGATVINNIDICDNSLIGAGAVVVNSVCERGIYIGVPARKADEAKRG